MNKYDPLKNRKHMVQVLDKCEPGENTPAVGKTYRFKSGAAYIVQPDGSLRCANTDVNSLVTGKAARKALKRARRAAREQARADVAAMRAARCPYHATAPGTDAVTEQQCKLPEGHAGEHKYAEQIAASVNKTPESVNAEVQS